ncbi:hypothetical protein DS745_15620 [Anaerobacillus alkaliphilus]|uniref:MoaD/ThiS family protein n=1 Tax=Anaerobacillus alkaliphilus TaxID=1548597 RepID=A0A4V1LFX6_9BACI|nr:MoaD/ThiS family protein [Anaerobacillus alkaliphilus]RXI97794.1 hypothetical protein DS745_15620 [Anaerobacillus alkaliphilus]
MTYKNKMIVKVVSFIPYLDIIQEEYYLEQTLSIGEFLVTLGLKWDEDALVVVNRVICSDEAKKLQDGDVIELLIPLSGG